MTTTIVTGSGQFDRYLIRSVLDGAGITKLLVADASKVEKAAAEWAKDRGVPYVTFAMEYGISRAVAVNNRNKLMLGKGAELVIAFPGGNSVTDMCMQAEQRGITIMRIER